MCRKIVEIRATTRRRAPRRNLVRVALLCSSSLHDFLRFQRSISSTRQTTDESTKKSIKSQRSTNAESFRTEETGANSEETRRKTKTSFVATGASSSEVWPNELSQQTAQQQAEVQSTRADSSGQRRQIEEEINLSCFSATSVVFSD